MFHCIVSHSIEHLTRTGEVNVLAGLRHHYESAAYCGQLVSGGAYECV
jgi:hypothetical protein